jgi:hypothetical protein
MTAYSLRIHCLFAADRKSAQEEEQEEGERAADGCEPATGRCRGHIHLYVALDPLKLYELDSIASIDFIVSIDFMICTALIIAITS